MVDINIYRISGFYVKGKTRVPFNFECRATSEENALEKAFSDVGSRHNVKRNRIFIAKEKGISIIDIEDTTNPEFLDYMEDDFEIYV